jgi:predicted DNA-binding transcriptional regulator YafY
MESPAARLLGLLSLLQSRPHWNGPELAERLGVTERTVRRDVTRLRDLGYPVEAEAGRAGGYQLGAGGALPPLLLTDDEAVAVALGLRAAASGGVSGYEEAAVAGLAKLEQVLPAHLRERVLALNASIVLVRSGGDAPIDPEVLLTLAQGCRRAERIRFAYRDGSGNETERRVEPYGLVNVDRRWYLVALDLDRDDWRTFRLDRMGLPALTGHRFVRTAEPDTAAMVLDGISLTPFAWQAEVVLQAGLDEAAAEVPASVGSLEPCLGGTLLRMGANELNWIARYLAGLPFAMEVRHPPELRAELRALGRRLQQANRA